MAPKNETKAAPRLDLNVTAIAALLSAVAALCAFVLLFNGERAVFSELDRATASSLNGAEASINRSLLSIDLLLAQTPELIGLVADTGTALLPDRRRDLLHSLSTQNILVQNISIIDPEGRALVTSESASGVSASALPQEFLAELNSQSFPTLTISAPIMSARRSERVIYFGRPVILRNTTHAIALAEVSVSRLTASSFKDIALDSLEITLERSDGTLLAGIPAKEQLLGSLIGPRLEREPQFDSERVRPDFAPMTSRVTAVPSVVMMRPTLYPGFSVTVSKPIKVAMQQWQKIRSGVLYATIAFITLILGLALIARNYVAGLARARALTAQSKALVDQALESMVEGFLLVDANYNVVTWNRRFIEIHPWLKGIIARDAPYQSCVIYTAERLFPNDALDARKIWVTQNSLPRPIGAIEQEQPFPTGRTIRISERYTPDGGLVSTFRDITASRTAAAEIENLAFYDALTNLPNRRMLMDRLQQAIDTSTQNRLPAALMFLDLDNFKMLNDTLGHETGDKLLVQVAARLSGGVRNSDTVARLGGDEFVVLLTSVGKDIDDAGENTARVCENIRALLAEPFLLEGNEYRSAASVGVTLINGDEHSADELLKQADIAMYQSKAAGRNAWRFYNPDMQINIKSRLALEADLRNAIAFNQFELFYQKQVNEQGRTVGAEALIRWIHPERGVVSPALFIPLSEEIGLINVIGAWVLNTACAQLSQWSNDPITRNIRLSINVSAHQFKQPTFAEQVRVALERSGADPRMLVLELTESVMLHDVEDCIVKMKTLGNIGVRFSIDDFGTGHSSLSYLTRLPIAELKIAMQFVHSVGNNESDMIVVQTIIGMTKNLGLEVIAEGVETEAQRAFLAANGCPNCQGYLFGKPLPLDVFEASLLADSAVACEENQPPDALLHAA
jgi:diguanylate cyclase (GGDEF)-like protein